MNEVHATITALYVAAWFFSAAINDIYDVDLYNWETKEDTIYSLLKIMFAPAVFIPRALYGIVKWAGKSWAEKPDTRKDI